MLRGRVLLLFRGGVTLCVCFGFHWSSLPLHLGHSFGGFCAWRFVSPSCCRTPCIGHSETCVFQGEQWRTVVVGRVSDSLDPDTAATFAEAEVRDRAPCFTVIVNL